MVLLGLGVAGFAIALHPPKLLGIFGQVGVYGIVAASAVPILFGVLFRAFDARGAMAAGSLGLTAHFGLYLWGRLDAAAPASLANPGVTATLALFGSTLVALIALSLTRQSHTRVAAPRPRPIEVRR